MKISALKGIGEKTEKIFNKAGIYTVDDLLEYYPRTYDIFSRPVAVKNVEVNRVCAIEGVIAGKIDVKHVRNLSIASTYIKDAAGDMIKCTWFNMPFLRNTLHFGDKYVFRGKINSKGAVYNIEQPQIYKPELYFEKLNEMQPVYPLTAGLNNKLVQKCVRMSLEISDTEKEYLPEKIRIRFELADRNSAIKNIHFPKTYEDYISARKRIVFDEFFLFISVLRRLRVDNEKSTNGYIIKDNSVLDDIISNLPYELTNAQRRTFNEIKSDLCGENLMNRLIQGDVGSGKTIVAFLSLILVVLNGFQGAIMAPTEVLARQHYESLMSLIQKNGLQITPVLLTGSMTAKEKRIVYEMSESGQADIIIGTHALIQEKVQYKNLALVITDEQHRFGVKQRQALGEKGKKPHTMVMSATPIPRTLAIILYGDLDISVIDELPSNRMPVKNCVVGTDYRPNAYRFIEKEVRKGRQAYVICPLVEESEASEGEDVISYSEKLRNIFPSDINVGCLHGRMKPAQKNDIMEKFAENKINVLVSTTVVEVGVNVPNATVMMIEDAEKFGLAGLHQLRGRVGRGSEQSYCILINSSDKPEAKKRLETLTKSNDGFFIANEDLRLRGPGDFFGVRQSGDMEFKMADIISDAAIMKKATDAVSMLENDTIKLTEAERNALNEHINIYTDKCADNINI